MKVLVTLGPSSLNQEIIKALNKEGVYLFRINLSHTPLNKLQNTVVYWCSLIIKLMFCAFFNRSKKRCVSDLSYFILRDFVS